MDDRFRRVGELFTRARQLPPDERGRFLSEQCAGDTELESDVRALLAQDVVTRSPLDRPAVAGMSIGDMAAQSAEPPEEIERYKLLQRIGEGGFGSVWMADQLEPIKRRVAIKIIKLGMDTRQVIARFEAERQALALMEHPNIARVLDAGSTRSGRPYFAMELVNGQPITDYCNAAGLDVPARLQLFSKVCNAIHHAHQKGIIHRDIKPSNVLITLHDGEPVPKVIDFGIAKATNAELTQRTLFTEHRQMIGTPAYMSPEQAEMSGLDIDTRSDIYSLGVLLYELLTGAPPFDSGTLLEAGFVEMVRIIREQEPPKPSTRLSGLNLSSPSALAIRNGDPRKLASALRGDLDWIAMKCLEKDRRRRYGSATDLLRDIERHLKHEPVSAGPPTTAYTLRKFVRRHRGPVVAGALIAGVVVLGIVGTTWGLLKALEERARANSEADRALLAAEQAETKARELDQVASFQEEQLANINVPLAATRLRTDLSLRVREALDARSGLSDNQRELRWKGFESSLRGVDFVGATLKLLDHNVFDSAQDSIKRRFATQPLVQARLLQSIASAMCGLGMLDEALVPQQEAVRIRREQLGERDAVTLRSVNELGTLLDLRGDIDGAEKHYREAADGLREVLGEAHPDTLYAMSCLGVLLNIKGEYTESEALQRAALNGLIAALGRDDRRTVTAMNNLGTVLRKMNRAADAEPYTREALEICRKSFANDDPLTLTAISNLGVHLRSQGQLTEAEPLYREALETRRRVLGDEHPDTLTSIGNMGGLLSALDKPKEAEPYYREAMETRRRTLGENHRQTLIATSNMSTMLRTLGRNDEALELARRAYDGSRALFGEDHAQSLTAAANLASLLSSVGQMEEAESLTRDTLERRKRTLGEGHRQTIISLSNLAALLEQQGKLQEAAGIAGDAAARAGRALPRTDSAVAGFHAMHASLLLQLDRFEEAERAGEAAYEAGLQSDGEGHRKTRASASFMITLYDRWITADAGAEVSSRRAVWKARLGQPSSPPSP